MKKPTDEQLAAARAYCQWHLGYEWWGDAIINAMTNPEDTMRRLREDGYEGDVSY